MRARPIPIVAAIVLSAMALTGCSSSSSTAAPSGSSKGNVIIGAADFTEIELMAQMYSELLQAKGFTTQITTVTNRELYEPALQNGQIDLVPDYAATMAEFLNTKVNGPNAAPVATSDATTTVAALNKLANPLGLTALTPAQAVDQNAFVVSQAYAT
ncbi:MAG: glycine betaine ABC transporter substrate-binding protein, partial [Candidatus Nanopelagicales bacterium]